MPLAQLNATPQTPTENAGWQFANVASHRDIIRRVFETKGVQLVEYPLMPFDPAVARQVQNFLNLHQDMHNAMNRALGLQSNNLSEVDWSDRNALAQWIALHFVEHQAASSLLGVS
jgi:hypothetical protein